MKYTDFETAYLEAMFWTESGEDDQELTEDHCFMSLAPETVIRVKADCDKFQELAGDLLDSAGDDSQNGHDFWLTRNGHGVGFWDRGYSDSVGDKLTEYAHAMGEVWIGVGDDDLLYF